MTEVQSQTKNELSRAEEKDSLYESFTLSALIGATFMAVSATTLHILSAYTLMVTREHLIVVLVAAFGIPHLALFFIIRKKLGIREAMVFAATNWSIKHLLSIYVPQAYWAVAFVLYVLYGSIVDEKDRETDNPGHED